MAALASSKSFWQHRSFGLYELLQSWWRHRVSFVISLAITFLALTIYLFTYIQEKTSPLLVFIQRVELSALDTRFRFRSAKLTPPDPRIVIVDVDQRSQEILGKWPFSRTYFAKTLDILHNDGARVAAFDITFDKPDQTAAPLRALSAQLEERKKLGTPVDQTLEAEVRSLAAEFDADSQFASSIKRFGPVVLGNFFLAHHETKGISDATLDQYADLIQWYAIANRNALNPATGKQDFENVVRRYKDAHVLPSATVANIPVLTSALNEEKASTGFFNITSDADGVLRRSTLLLPYGRSTNYGDWDFYGSLEVQAVRLYLDVPGNQVTANFNVTGIVSLELADKLRLKPDPIGRMSINYHGPERTYPYYSIADVVGGLVPPGTFKDKIVLVGVSATGVGDLRSSPYG